MKTYGLIVGLVVLLISGEIVRRAAVAEERLADAEQRLLVGPGTETAGDALATAAAALDRVPILGNRLQQTVRKHRATAAYWNRDYEAARALISADEPEPDPELILLDANASFRQAFEQNRNPVTVARALEDVLQKYVAVIEAAPESTTAAFNYEFVARLRMALSSSRGSGLPSLPPQELHGDQGQPPDNARKSDFNVIVPLRPEERQDQTTPGAASTFQRKG
jgi:hypothetical protein